MEVTGRAPIAGRAAGPRSGGDDEVVSHGGLVAYGDRWVGPTGALARCGPAAGIAPG